jgi:hypothetical protein
VDNNGSKHGVPLEFDDKVITPSPDTIRKFEDIPDLMSMEIPPLEWLVDGLISRGSMTLWAGADGTGKTYLVQKMAVAVASGTKFLGRRCQQAACLYLDYENPAYAIKDRLEVLAGGPVPNLKVWGTWLEQQPPQLGNSLLLEIAREARPLIIVDPFRYAHGAEENDSTAMMGVMQQLRYCAAKGSAVVILHHVAKAEGSNGRGSTAIRGAVDLAYVQTMDAESGLISVRCDKNRFGEAHYSITIRPDFDEGTFEVTDSPAFMRRNQELETLKKIITDQPGLSQNQIYQKSRMMRARVFKLLKENTGTLWQVQEQGRSRLYFPMVLETRTTPRTIEPCKGFGGGSMVLLPLGGEPSEPPTPNSESDGSSDHLVCDKCGIQGEWSTSIGLGRHRATCKGRVQ